MTPLSFATEALKFVESLSLYRFTTFKNVTDYGTLGLLKIPKKIKSIDIILMALKLFWYHTLC